MRLDERILNEVKKAVFGKDELLEKILIAILAKGHILLEDIPGVGKTTIAKTFAQVLGLKSKRMQFTVDILPSDVVGFTMIDPETKQAKLYPGAVFCNIFLADEINRTSSRTQAALLEVMEENNITVDGITYPAWDPFIVIATQNPYGSAGTQPLPDSQLERFLMRLSCSYPDAKTEIRILKSKEVMHEIPQQIMNEETIKKMQSDCEQVFIHDDLYAYIVTLIQKTRNHPAIQQGASPRGSIALAAAARARAYLHERNYVLPEDIQAVFIDVLSHRIHLADPQANKEDNAAILHSIIKETNEPSL
ncbi:AAA family ATPase [Merdibacter massiliensis]|uniref:AAA family ATPase n=1 Tax=Merdibacter massiliensis TaxID=1871030 RepID=UPI00096A925B|nr:MoxR family ATPase [Merdibacter massiliensis]